MSNEEEAFEQLFHYYPGVIILLARLGFSAEDAKDLAQDVFLKVWRHMREARQEARWPYIAKTTRLLAHNTFRERHTHKRSAIIVPLDSVSDNPDYGLDLDEKVQRAELYAAIDKLESPERVVMLLLLSSFSYNEIAVKLDVTVAAVKSRVFSARNKLADMMVSRAVGQLAISGNEQNQNALYASSSGPAKSAHISSSDEQMLRDLIGRIPALSESNSELANQFDAYENMLAGHVSRIESSVGELVTKLESA